MFIIVDSDTTFAPVTYPIDTPEQERRARIALAAAGLESVSVWTGQHGGSNAFRTAARLYALRHDQDAHDFLLPRGEDDEITAVYTPSPALLRAATRHTV